MTNEEQWKKNLDDAMLITTNLVLKHAEVAQEHEDWLRDHSLAMVEHNKAMAKHNLAIQKHDEQIAEIRTSLLDLTKRLGGGTNGHGDA